MVGYRFDMPIREEPGTWIQLMEAFPREACEIGAAHSLDERGLGRRRERG
jgi:hypothetical protein